MVIDFLEYRAKRIAQEAAVEAERQAELARRDHLEQFLSAMLLELEAA